MFQRGGHKRSCSVGDASTLSGRNMNGLAQAQLTCASGTPGIQGGLGNP